MHDGRYLRCSDDVARHEVAQITCADGDSPAIQPERLFRTANERVMPPSAIRSAGDHGAGWNGPRKGIHVACLGPSHHGRWAHVPWPRCRSYWAKYNMRLGVQSK